jgi:hypothetical protein
MTATKNPKLSSSLLLATLVRSTLAENTASAERARISPNTIPTSS